MTERFMVDDAGTLIDMTNRNTYDYVSDVCDLLNELHEEAKDNEHYHSEVLRLYKAVSEENEQLKQELKVYRKVASCSNCKYHNYDWYIDDGYGGEEYEVCDKGNDVTERICKEWREL